MQWCEAGNLKDVIGLVIKLDIRGPALHYNSDQLGLQQYH